jgi:hypothetical protein
VVVILEPPSKTSVGEGDWGEYSAKVVVSTIRQIALGSKDIKFFDTSRAFDTFANQSIIQVQGRAFHIWIGISLKDVPKAELKALSHVGGGNGPEIGVRNRQ